MRVRNVVLIVSLVLAGLVVAARSANQVVTLPMTCSISTGDFTCGEAYCSTLTAAFDMSGLPVLDQAGPLGQVTFAWSRGSTVAELPRVHLPQYNASRSQKSFSPKEFPRVRADMAVQVGRLRRRKNWGWNDLARAAGVSAVLVEGLERGTRDVQFSTVLKLAKAAGVYSLDEILGPSALERAAAHLEEPDVQ